MPAKTSAGKAMNPPPPATELITPAMTAATKSRKACGMCACSTQQSSRRRELHVQVVLDPLADGEAAVVIGGVANAEQNVVRLVRRRSRPAHDPARSRLLASGQSERHRDVLPRRRFGGRGERH